MRQERAAADVRAGRCAGGWRRGVRWCRGADAARSPRAHLRAYALCSRGRWAHAACRMPAAHTEQALLEYYF